MSPGLADRLREATRPLHRQVERAGIMPALLRGDLPRRDYGELLRNLFAIYDALERALRRHAGRAELAPIALPELFRAEALAADLNALAAADWPDWPLQPAAFDYVERLHELDRHEPARLAAHAYVRYLGDLSGGQIVGRIVGERLHLAGVVGRRFYDFGSAAAANDLAARFRRGLDSDAVAAQAEAIIEEAGLAFRLHARLFEELDGRAPRPGQVQPRSASRRTSP